MTGVFRVYDDVCQDGYPAEWHAEIKHLVREQAGHRCVRCGHPYRNGEHGNGEWSPCDERCSHGAPIRYGRDVDFNGWAWLDSTPLNAGDIAKKWDRVEARWRILTVHHIDGDKANCRWWNLVSLCQRCHLTIQGRVLLERVYPFEHSDWFKPYAAGWYAYAYLGEDLTRDQVDARLDELLALERIA